jgi:hypothetical protein
MNMSRSKKIVDFGLDQKKLEIPKNRSKTRSIDNA